MKDFSIDETLSFLIAQTCKNHRGKTNEMLSKVGLYTGQEMILSYLSKHKNIPQNNLVSAMGVQPATITKGLQRLEKSGYIRRDKSEDDARVININLTNQGIQIQNSINKIWNELETITFQGFTEPEKIVFRRLLLQIINNFESL